MKNAFPHWLKVLPATLGCMLIVSVASAQQNVPLAQNGVVPGMLPHGMAGQPMNPDLFYNYYPNTYAGATSAQMYVAPLPVPANVGHTYYTYPALLPHEYLYAHKRVYYTPYAGPSAFYQGNPYSCQQGCTGGVNKTTVTWSHGGFNLGSVPFQILPLENLRRLTNRSCSCGGAGCTSCR